MWLRQLRIIRKQNKLSQQQIADVLGVSRSTYCSYETGRRNPDFETIVKLSNFYRISTDSFTGEVKADYLNDEDYYEGREDTRYLSQLSKKERDLIVNLRMLSEQEKCEVEKLIKEKTSK